MQVVHGYPYEFVHLLEVKHLVDIERVHVRRHRHPVGNQAVLLGIGDGVHRSDEGWHVAPGLAGEIFVDRPEIGLSSGSLDGFVDIPCSAVVGGDGKVPVPEDTVRVPEVTGRGIGRLHRVKPFVDKGIYPEPIEGGRPVHELPHAFGSGPGHRDRIEGGFYDSQIFKFQRHVVLRENLFEDRHVILAESQDVGHLRGHFLRVQDDVVPDGLVEGEGDEGIHRSQPLEVDLVRGVGGQVYHVHVEAFPFTAVLNLVVQVPKGEEAVGDRRVVILRIEACGAPGPADLIHVHDVGGQAVGEPFVVLVFFYVALERVYLPQELGVLVRELATGFLGGGRRLLEYPGIAELGIGPVRDQEQKEDS